MPVTRSLWPLAVCSSADKAYTHGVSLCSRRHSEDEREEEDHSSFLGGRDQELGVHVVSVGSAARGWAGSWGLCVYLQLLAKLSGRRGTVRFRLRGFNPGIHDLVPPRWVPEAEDSRGQLGGGYDGPWDETGWV